MLSNPLFWMELQFLPEERRRELKSIMKVWREIRNDIAHADISPIGQMPCGRSFTGFKIKGKEKSYLLLFREITSKDSFEFELGEEAEVVNTLISNTEINAVESGERIKVYFNEPRAYAIIEVKLGEKNV